MENKLCRIADNMRALHQPDQYSSKASFEFYDETFRRLVELCEDYWYILRLESALFCLMPQITFPAMLAQQVTASFTLKMIVISLVGFLVSNQEYRFQD